MFVSVCVSDIGKGGVTGDFNYAEEVVGILKKYVCTPSVPEYLPTNSPNTLKYYSRKIYRKLTAFNPTGKPAIN